MKYIIYTKNIYMTRFFIEFAKWLRLNMTIKNIKATKKYSFCFIFVKGKSGL